MLGYKKALMLIGSPKAKNSTSEALGNYLLNGLNKKGYIAEKLHIPATLKHDVQGLIDKVNETDLLIIAFPLYVDSLPSPLIKALELIAEHRNNHQSDKLQSLMVIINCGFPEAHQNDTALRICKSFASHANFKWLGGLAMGGGPAIGGKPIDQLGGMTRNLVKVLDMAIEAIADNKEIPIEAIDLMSAKLFPGWIFTLFADRGWKTQAKQYGVQRLLYAKPYVKE